MSTALYPSPLSGIIHSRRLGLSLGINLLPPDGKLCTFDCLYCECGYNAERRPHQPMPTREAVITALEKELRVLKGEDNEIDRIHAEGAGGLDVLTFSGNGEPTLHPDFPAIVDDVLRLRDRYFPQAKVTVLTNATQVVRPAIREALMRVDNAICKLDTVSPAYIKETDRPTGHYDVGEIVEALHDMHGHPIIQTIFLLKDGTANTGEEYVGTWLDTLRYIQPREVMVYTIDRPTPYPNLQKVTPAELDAIRDRVVQAGFPCIAAY